MPFRSFASRLVLTGCVAAGDFGCRVFDPNRYLRDVVSDSDGAAPPSDGPRMDVLTGPFDTFPEDVPVGPSDSPTDARDGGAAGDGSDAMVLPAVSLTDRCDGVLPVVTSSRTAYTMDTTALRDDFNQLTSCTGSLENGFNGFFAVDMRVGEKWHIHVKVRRARARTRASTS